MDPVQALAIFSLGAFLTVLVTAVFYAVTVRPRLMDPLPPESMDRLSETLHVELSAQRAALEQINADLAEHVARLHAGIASREAYGSLAQMLAEQTARLDRIDRRMDAPSPGAAYEELMDLVHQQTERLGQMGQRLESWQMDGEEQRRILAELDREIEAQTELSRRIDTRIAEQTTLLVSAATERERQTGTLERLTQQVERIFPLLRQRRAALDEYALTAITGIGPVYAGKLYNAGIKNFNDLVSKSPDEIRAVIAAPKWRAGSVDAESWIEQAKEFAAREAQS